MLCHFARAVGSRGCKSTNLGCSLNADWDEFSTWFQVLVQILERNLDGHLLDLIEQPATSSVDKARVAKICLFFLWHLGSQNQLQLFENKAEYPARLSLSLSLCLLVFSRLEKLWCHVMFILVAQQKFPFHSRGRGVESCSTVRSRRQPFVTFCNRPREGRISPCLW